MKNIFPLITEHDREVLHGIIAIADLGHEVEIRPHEPKRSLNQNSLYWEWVTIYASELGEVKEQLHQDLKERHLKPIYIRDIPTYAELIELIRDDFRAGNEQRAKRLYRELIKMTSTTRASRKQMAEYMEQVELEAAGNNCILPRPADRKKEFEEGDGS